MSTITVGDAVRYLRHGIIVGVLRSFINLNRLPCQESILDLKEQVNLNLSLKNNPNPNPKDSLNLNPQARQLQVKQGYPTMCQKFRCQNLQQPAPFPVPIQIDRAPLTGRTRINLPTLHDLPFRRKLFDCSQEHRWHFQIRRRTKDDWIVSPFVPIYFGSILLELGTYYFGILDKYTLITFLNSLIWSTQCVLALEPPDGG